jgi:hypothetical protein
MAVVLATVLGAIVSLVAAETIDPLNTGAQYAWGENIGWLNAEPNVAGNPGVTVSGIKLTGYMWGENVGWINLNCSNNNTCATTGNYGVKNNGIGGLSGYAWGENIGWISFSCRNAALAPFVPFLDPSPASCASNGNYGVTIDPVTGLFSGKAWGENVGWIVFDYTTQTASRVKTADDGDGIAYPSDKCPFDNNASQVNTDAANTGVDKPGSDLLGDACDPDKDGDGYTLQQEQAVGFPASKDLTYCATMRADVDGDALISAIDLALVAGYFTQTAPERYKQDSDGVVSIIDLALMAQDFTKSVTVCL